MAASTAATVVAGKTVFDYNRENFLLDREMRLKKEFAERRYRITQSKLWREDVRCFVELTERKMAIYLLVNVLMLGFNFNLWCEGRLPEGTPEWMMMGNQLAIASSFTFLFLTVWLAMHAAVAAQSLQTRVLTQLIRLPVPTWDELEACRTYGSEFERVEPRQMFRIPFITGCQESHVQGSAAAVQTPLAANATATDENLSAPRQAIATDPWGLERRGDSTYELGCQMGDEVAKLRHIKIMRQAAVYWQTYDAFARVSMSVGTNQLMLAISYYILGYEVNEIHAPLPAFAGIIILICTQEVIAQIDLTLPPRMQRLFQFMVLFGPCISFLAAYHATIHKELARWVSECLAPFAFISHGLVVGLLTVLLRVTEQENGAMIPLAFQGVLFLDVFGWVYHKDAGPQSGVEQFGETGKNAALAVPQVSKESTQQDLRTSPKSVGSNDMVGYYATDYVEPYAKLAEKGADSEEEDEFDDVECDLSATALHRQSRPALASMTYDDQWEATPSRPEDQMPPGAMQDLRYMSGAPRMWETVNAIEPPAKGFWDPVTFMPSEGRRRRKMDELLNDVTEEADSGKTGLSRFLMDMPIETGHDNEAPGLVPWQTFRLAAVMTCLVWLCAGAYCLLQVTGLWRFSLNLFRSIEHDAIPHGWATDFDDGSPRQVLPRPSMITLWKAELTRSYVGGAPERIHATWPYPSIEPRGLACDRAGEHFVVIDGLSAFSAELNHKPSNLRSQNGPGPAVVFKQTPLCQAHMGEALLDAAVVCSSSNRTRKAQCDALLLQRNGRHLAHCALVSGENDEKDSSMSISDRWLHTSNDASLSLDSEEISWIFVDSACGNSGGNATAQTWDGCASFGTNQGRQAKLRRRSSSKDLVPFDIPSEDESVVDGAAESSSMRAFDSRYVGLLQPERQSIHLLDAHRGGAFSGSLLLPTDTRISGFCVGGGHVYMLEDGPSPAMWRFPVPLQLRSQMVNTALP